MIFNCQFDGCPGVSRHGYFIAQRLKRLSPHQIADIWIAFDNENLFPSGCHGFLRMRRYVPEWIF